MNVNMGFEKNNSPVKGAGRHDAGRYVQKVGMTMYSAVGGSSGALYGSGYMAAGRACAGKAVLMYTVCMRWRRHAAGNHEAWKTEPGQKTMIDDYTRHFVHTGKDWTQAGVMKKSFRILWKAPQTVRSVQRKWKL